METDINNQNHLMNPRYTVSFKINGSKRAVHYCEYSDPRLAAEDLKDLRKKGKIFGVKIDALMLEITDVISYHKL